MSAPKNSFLQGLLVKAESSYLGGGSLSTSTDGIVLAQPVELARAYAAQSDRRATGVGGWYRQAAPVGYVRSGTITVHPRGAGVAYSSGSVVPYDVHVLLTASGHTAAVTTTGGSERWDYTPTTGPSGFTSAVIQGYARGELVKVAGVYADLTITADGPGLPTFAFAFDGVEDMTAFADSSVPSITVNTTVVPPNAAGASVAIGSFTTASVRRFAFAPKRARAPRFNLNTASGHGGFTLANREPEFTVSVEKTALVANPFHTAGGLDVYRLADAATPIALSVTVGTTQYNRWKVVCPQAQLVGIAESDDGGTAVVDLTFRPHQSTPYTADDYYIRFD